jgi:hypothetical protein
MTPKVIRFPINSDPKFTAVAGLIAKPPPDWLLPGLAYFSEFVGAETKTADWPEEGGRATKDCRSDALGNEVPNRASPEVQVHGSWLPMS